MFLLILLVLGGVAAATILALHKPADHCKKEPCEYDGKCVAKDNDFSCKCLAGYDGKRCQGEFGANSVILHIKLGQIHGTFSYSAILLKRAAIYDAISATI